MTTKAIATILACVCLASCRRNEEPLVVPTLNDLGTVWIGEGEGGSLEYFRLDLRPDGTGVLAVQYLPDAPAVAYRVVRTYLDRLAIRFELEPVDAGAERIDLRGHATASELTVIVGNTANRWERRLLLRPYAREMKRLAAVTARTEAYTRTGR